MSLPDSGESAVIGTATIRAALPGHTQKRLERLMGLKPDTAKHWLYNGPAAARRRELARRLLEEMDREDQTVRADARRALSELAEVE
jgi:hypothetical protein